MIPSHVLVGDHITVFWNADPDPDDDPARSIELSVLLVAHTAQNQRSCGSFQSAKVLDVMRTSELDHQQYRRSILIPLNVQSGIYWLVIQEKRIEATYGGKSSCTVSSIIIEKK